MTAVSAVGAAGAAVLALAMATLLMGALAYSEALTLERPRSGARVVAPEAWRDAQLLATLEPTTQWWGAQRPGAAQVRVAVATDAAALCAAFGRGEGSDAARAALRAALGLGLGQGVGDVPVAVMIPEEVNAVLMDCWLKDDLEWWTRVCDVLGPLVVYVSSPGAALTPGIFGNYRYPPQDNRPECGSFDALEGNRFQELVELLARQPQGAGAGAGAALMVQLEVEPNHFAEAFKLSSVATGGALAAALFFAAGVLAAAVLRDRSIVPTKPAMKMVLVGNCVLGLTLAVVVSLDGLGMAQPGLSVAPYYFFVMLLFGQSAALDALLAMMWDTTGGVLERSGSEAAGSPRSSALYAGLALAASLLDLVCNSLLAFQAVPVALYSIAPSLVALVQLATGVALVLKGRALRRTLLAIVPRGTKNDGINLKLLAFHHRLAMAGQLSGLFATLNTLLLLGAYKLKTSTPPNFIAVGFLAVLLRVGNMYAQVLYCVKPPVKPSPKTWRERVASTAGALSSVLAAKIAPAPHTHRGSDPRSHCVLDPHASSGEHLHSKPVADPAVSHSLAT